MLIGKLAIAVVMQTIVFVYFFLFGSVLTGPIKSSQACALLQGSVAEVPVIVRLNVQALACRASLQTSGLQVALRSETQTHLPLQHTGAQLSPGLCISLILPPPDLNGQGQG